MTRVHTHVCTLRVSVAHGTLITELSRLAVRFTSVQPVSIVTQTTGARWKLGQRGEVQLFRKAMKSNWSFQTLPLNWKMDDAWTGRLKTQVDSSVIGSFYFRLFQTLIHCRLYIDGIPESQFCAFDTFELFWKRQDTSHFPVWRLWTSRADCVLHLPLLVRPLARHTSLKALRKFEQDQKWRNRESEVIRAMFFHVFFLNNMSWNHHGWCAWQRGETTQVVLHILRRKDRKRTLERLD